MDSGGTALRVGVLTASARLRDDVGRALAEHSAIVRLLSCDMEWRHKVPPAPIDILVVDDEACTVNSPWPASRRGLPHAPLLVFINVRDDRRCAYLLRRGADEAIVARSPSQSVRLSLAAKRAGQLRVPIEISVGDIHIDHARRRVTCADDEVHLTTLEWDVLLCLVHHYPRPASIADLASFVWGETTLEKAYSRVQVYVHYLRYKLAKSRVVRFENVRGVGYCLTEKESVQRGQRSRESA